MRTDLLRGLWVASLTPLAADGSIDAAALARHCKSLIADGCDGVALFGTTGEGQSFSVRERITALESVLKAGVPKERVVVGTGCAAAPDAVELTRHAIAADIAAAMLLPSFFWKGQCAEDVTASLSAVIDGVNDPSLRVILYHIPQVSAVAIDLPTVAALRKRYGTVIAGIKDSSADFTHFDIALSAFPDMLHFVGAEPQLARVLEVGGAGTICGLGNVVPRLMAQIRDKRSAATAAQRDIEALCRYFAGRSFLPIVKAMLASLTGDVGWRRTRAPMRPVGEAAAAEIGVFIRELLESRRAA
ncbi:MAG: dihydrodipicolinate synthase family protein [Alphaproteobacteria bacterium]|nr:dihydrodipicolinate synthase family protein [Alphaproteobacteria bacterium]